ncbi:hypothetical protein Agub_g3599 [Astrephomene gubernaculifera]|uniref:Uncharacterized protein n=1 Tax=Astrephomene gubernaculifera TaxID=47775 RepID=A0AAD3DKY6_9CHLO|nr:hypothetical protein Agub_g3599 [Astrephomene gubernaculifera]
MYRAPRFGNYRSRHVRAFLWLCPAIFTSCGVAILLAGIFMRRTLFGWQLMGLGSVMALLGALLVYKNLVRSRQQLPVATSPPRLPLRFVGGLASASAVQQPYSGHEGSMRPPPTMYRLLLAGSDADGGGGDCSGAGSTPAPPVALLPWQLASVVVFGVPLPAPPPLPVAAGSPAAGGVALESAAVPVTTVGNGQGPGSLPAGVEGGCVSEPVGSVVSVSVEPVGSVVLVLQPHAQLAGWRLSRVEGSTTGQQAWRRRQRRRSRRQQRQVEPVGHSREPHPQGSQQQAHEQQQPQQPAAGADQSSEAVAAAGLPPAEEPRAAPPHTSGSPPQHPQHHPHRQGGGEGGCTQVEIGRHEGPLLAASTTLEYQEAPTHTSPPAASPGVLDT